jgi:Rrf2 family transcriptional regulator, cysteine metabolism repressor
MPVTQKCQYTLRALFELGKRRGTGPLTVAEIAQAQGIPRRFLETIIADLRQAGYVRSQRGAQGGYVLAFEPEEITVATIIRFVEGLLAPVPCLEHEHRSDCPMDGQCAFKGLWRRAQLAVEKVYQETTLMTLIAEERGASSGPAEYSI